MVCKWKIALSIKNVRGDIMGLLKICDRIIARTNMFGRQCMKTNLLIYLLERYSLLSMIVTNFKCEG